MKQMITVIDDTGLITPELERGLNESYGPIEVIRIHRKEHVPQVLYFSDLPSWQEIFSEEKP